MADESAQRTTEAGRLAPGRDTSTVVGAFHFHVEARLPGTAARAAVLSTPHGEVRTPAFIPVGTLATVKSLTPDDLLGLGAEIILANTYHLYLRPGADLVAALGGLHDFMAWQRPILTDSGGYQVFSLGFALEHGVGKIARTFPGPEASAPRQPIHARLARIDDDGVTFTSHVDGSTHRLTPEKSIEIQEKLGADIILAFDECTSPLSSYEYTRQATQRTHRWALRCLEARRRADQGLFGVVQGGAFQDLREESARFIGGLPFAGFAIGGSLGKSKADMHDVLGWVVPRLPEDRARHLLGIGEPEDLLECVERGVDLFDCVAPTRLGRHGILYTPDGRLNIRNAAFRIDPRPPDAECECYTCRHFSRAYLRHLFVAEELLGYRLATIHNLHFTLTLVRNIRRSILDGTFQDLKAAFLARYHPQPGGETSGDGACYATADELA